MQATILETIEHLKNGKKVSISTPFGYMPISAWVSKGPLPTLQVLTASRRHIKVSYEHLFFAAHGEGDKVIEGVKGFWKKAINLSVGDYLVTDDLTPDMITDIITLPDCEIFDITVEHDSHCYFGNGLLHHNTGKSLLAQHALIATQRKGGIGIMVDAEYAFNPEWYRGLGGTPEDLIVYEPMHIDECYGFMAKAVATIRAKDATVPITIVYDSVAASPSKAEAEGAEYDMGKRALAHGKGVRMLMGMCAREHVTLITVNQFRKALGCVVADTKITWRLRE